MDDVLSRLYEVFYQPDNCTPEAVRSSTKEVLIKRSLYYIFVCSFRAMGADGDK